MSTVDMRLGELLEMAMGVDRDWMQFGSCHGWGTKPENEDNPNPWHVVNNKMYGPDGDISGAELVEYALIVCAGCIAQYDCARFAVNTHADFVTSSMRVGDLRWLQKQANWGKIVDIAEVVSVPIQQAVVTVRRGGRVTA